MEPGNLVDSYRRSIRIVPIACQSKRRDVCTAAQRGRGDTVVVVKIFHWEGEPQRELDTATTTSFTYTPIDHSNHGIYLQRRNPLLLMRYNSIYTVRHLYAAKPYLAGGRPASRIYYPLPLYTLIHPVRFNMLAAQVLGLSRP